MATTAFCTVLLVTSAGFLMSWLASICLVHDMPKTEIGGLVSVALRRRVKYEKSSVDLVYRQGVCSWGGDSTFEKGKLYACAPSESAINGRKDQSLSAAGSLSSPAPNQLSISGPL